MVFTSRSVPEPCTQDACAPRVENPLEVILLTKKLIKLVALTIALVGLANVVTAQQTNQTRPPDPAATRQTPAANFKAPDNIDFRTANIMSEGVRLQAELFSLKSSAGKPLPTII